MSSRPLLTVPFLALLGSGCGTVLPGPEVEYVEPNWAYNGERTEVTVHGANFFPSVEVDSSQAGGHLDQQFNIRLERDDASYDLEQVVLASYSSLVGFVPAGLPIGAYGLLVETPEQQQASLSSNFIVTDTRADHLAFDIDEVSYEVNETFWLNFSLFDPEGDPVTDSLEVKLSVTSDDLAAGIELVSSSWGDEGSATFDGQAHIFSGPLSSNGEGRIALTSSLPDNLDITLHPLDTGSVVTGDTVKISIDPGQVSVVRIELPEDDFQATAGEAFNVVLTLVDGWNNPVEDGEATLILTEACGAAAETVAVQGSTELLFAATGATGEDCENNLLTAAGTASGVSETFQVRPAKAAAYEVHAFPTQVIAGSGLLGLVVYVEDAWANLVTDYGEGVELTVGDDAGGLHPAEGMGELSCGEWQAGELSCTARLWTASERDRVTFTGSDGLSGRSSNFTVQPNEMAALSVDVEESSVLAGASYEVKVLPQDVYGNAIGMDPSVEPFTISGAVGEPICVWDGLLPADGWRTFDCQSFTATDWEVLTVEIRGPSAEVARASDPFQVQNGDITVVYLAGISEGDSFTAGESIPLSLSAWDAWGNPYLAQHSGNALTLTDTTGSLTPALAYLDADGTGNAPVIITHASQLVSIDVTIDSTALATSPSFTVVHAAFDDLALSMDKPWAFIGEERGVEVQALDAYGNLVADFSEPVTVGTQHGTASNVLLSAFTGGVGVATLQFTSARVAETVTASCVSLSTAAELTPIDVLTVDCSAVTADLLVEGAEFWVDCTSPGSPVSVALDATGSTGTGLAFHYSDNAGQHERTTATSTSFSWEEDMGVLIELVAFDATACGATDTATVYVAQDDLEPAGVVVVTPAWTERTLGSPADSASTINIYAEDCTGDPSFMGTLYIRSDRGEFTGGVTTTGQGLAVTLDAYGEASVTWSVLGDDIGGEAQILVGRRDGAAMGSATIEVVGDSANPHVVAIDPQGTSDVDEAWSVSIWFDEEMVEDFFTMPKSDAISITGPDGLMSIDSLMWDAEDLRLDLLLAEAISPASESYTLKVMDQPRDLAGNALDGGWYGLRSQFQASFGAVANTAPDVLTCEPDTATLRPDGDHMGASIEADSVDITVNADSAPGWWLMEVLDTDGIELLVEWTKAASDTELLTWDARGADGAIEPNGAYTVSITAMDNYLNLGMPCTTTITIDNPLAVLQ